MMMCTDGYVVVGYGQADAIVEAPRWAAFSAGAEHVIAWPEGPSC
jgi:hypothetical protein